MIPPNNIRRNLQRIAAVLLVIFFFSDGIAYVIRNTPPIYLESATVVFSLPKSKGSPKAYFMLAKSLITSGQAMSQILGSPKAQRQIRKAGGTATTNLALVNLYDQEYPNYGLPLATLSASSSYAADVHRTFVITALLLPRLLAAVQAHEGVRPHNRITVQITGDTGLTTQVGSVKRVLVGLAVLALVALSALLSVIGRSDAKARYRSEIWRSLAN